jgi:hypothetical protein
MLDFEGDGGDGGGGAVGIGGEGVGFEGIGCGFGGDDDCLVVRFVR